MKRYLIPIGSIGGVTLFIVGFFMLTIGDAYGYARKGDPYALPSGCGAKTVTAIQSVHPGVVIADVQRWYCRRTLHDQIDPNGAVCHGVYDAVLSGETWWSNVTRTCLDENDVWIPGCTNGFGAWWPIAVNHIAETVTVRRRGPITALDAAQLAAHAPLFSNGCMLDDDEVAVAWGNLVDFTIYRLDNDDVVIQLNHATTEPSPLDVAEEVMDNKALWPLTE